jgi:tetratricopeptide (TPR) repeat protein
MRKSLWILIVIFGSGIVASQKRSFGTLPLVNKKTSTQSATRSSGSMEDSPKYQHALRIFNKLVEARGDFRYPVPTLTMSKTVQYVASMDYQKLEIDLEEKAYDVCMTMGDSADAAIAFLLAHELSHYYEKHAWKRGFVADFRDLSIGMKLDSIQDDVANETEADYIGGFLAYSAGFGLFDRGAEIIKNLYKAYQIPNKISGYPSLSDRQTMSKRTNQKIKQLIEVFDMANLLTAVGNYAEANEYYRYVLQDYQSREIYNNLGVTALLNALEFFSDSELKFRYPIQLDLSSSARGDGFADKKDILIRQALLHFDAAISLDPNYAPAYLNKACAFALLGEVERARFYGNVEARAIALKNKDAKTVRDVNILMGILDATAGNTESAKKLFSKAAEEGSSLAAFNLKILNNEQLGTELESFGGFSRAEQIDGQNLKALILEDAFIGVKSLTINNNVIFHRISKQGPGSYLFIGQNDRNSTRVFFHCTKPGYTGETSRKIKRGDDQSDIITKYGQPKTTIETPLGQIMVYKSIIFITGKNNKLDNWIVYSKEE